MSDQSTETANQSAHDAAGPPPRADAFKHSGLVDQPLGFVRRFVDKVADLLGGNTKSN